MAPPASVPGCGQEKYCQHIGLCASLGSSEENHLPHFRKSDIIDDVTVTSWMGDDVTCQFS